MLNRFYESCIFTVFPHRTARELSYVVYVYCFFLRGFEYKANYRWTNDRHDYVRMHILWTMSTNLSSFFSAVTLDHVVPDIDSICSRMISGCEMSLRFQTVEADIAAAAITRRRRYSTIVDGLARCRAPAALPWHHRPNDDRMCSPTTGRKRVTSSWRHLSDANAVRCSRLLVWLNGRRMFVRCCVQLRRQQVNCSPLESHLLDCAQRRAAPPTIIRTVALPVSAHVRLVVSIGLHAICCVIWSAFVGVRKPCTSATVILHCVSKTRHSIFYYNFRCRTSRPIFNFYWHIFEKILYVSIINIFISPLIRYYTTP